MMSFAALEYSQAHQGATQKILAIVEQQSQYPSKTGNQSTTAL